ncbi:MAG: LD-carboxypeptidase [Thermoplasmata archaeon]|jgi:muramoyltetrapeptide carboxypeptidase|nr:LD-carboxypeptidase [Thermoplasmata archaeon]MVT13253.1 LD-carboxypeptidase [Euryarchaeota archaeon]MVT14734.1 LD-carboxypeptidase [Euryarchaeota archaeon]MVT35974.1 LD-carboxypeptidase [Euryarchaeota archaeon]
MRAPSLKKGGHIRIIAPASPPNLRSLTVGVEKLRKMGYKVSFGENIRKLKRIGYLSAPDVDRARELENAFLDDSVDAIFCARGGYGSLRILPLIDFEIIKEHPKIFLGYSDITALHIAINQKADLITFHGPMPAVDYETIPEPFLKFMMDFLAGETTDLTSQITRIVGILVEGNAEGKSAGTNFSLVTSLIGTEYQLKAHDRILFLEDVATSIYDIDRYMAELWLTKILYRVKGLAFGDFTQIPVDEGPTPSLQEVIYYYVSNMKKPAIYGLPFGHGTDQMIIPLNARIKLSTEEPFITLLEDILD